MKINDIDKDAKITLIHETQGRCGDEEMFDTGVLDDEEVLAEPEVTVKDVNLSVDEVTLAQALTALKSEKVEEKANVVKEPSESITTTPTLTTTTTVATIITAVSTRPKAKGLVIHEEEQATTPIVSSQQPSQVKAQDKGKGICYKLKKKGLPEKKLKEKKKTTVFHEKSELFVQLLEARKKHFAVMRAQEMRNKPPTQAQNRNTMSTYLKNMAGYKHNQLKNKSFDDIQKLFDKAMNRVNTFVDMDTELVEGSEVRAKGSETRVEGSSKRA
ncbi:hypothetical protein Tco_0393995 [Tanacetum coccineum]